MEHADAAGGDLSQKPAHERQSVARRHPLEHEIAGDEIKSGIARPQLVGRAELDIVTPCRAASSRATPSIPAERSTAVTVPPRRAARRASGIARRPTPHPYSRIAVGPKSGASRSWIVRHMKSTSVSPPAKNSARVASVIRAVRNFWSVKTVK